MYKKSSDSCIEIVQAVHVYDTDYSRLQLSCIAREIKYCPKKCKESLNGQKQITVQHSMGKAAFSLRLMGFKGLMSTRFRLITFS